jgi:TonB-dependent starch-binding outer membrane protein SusC
MKKTPKPGIEFYQAMKSVWIKLSIISFLLIAGALNVFSTGLQQREVQGRVTDNTGAPLPGVTIVIKGTTTGTQTNIDGNYSIPGVEKDDVLVFSFVGMATREILVGDQTIIAVTMQTELIGLDEVVAIGYGTQRRANVIGSVTTVRSEEITSSPASRVSNMLAGRLPGGIFMQESGIPGNDQATIRVRGNATLGNNAPLIVIDGITGRDLNSLHPDDIESITVLKDASAAIYGARAANGVILVTTKRGAADTPPTFTYSFYEGFLSPTMLPEMADAPTYAQMIREYQTYQGTAESNMMFSLDDIEKFKSGAYPWTHPNTNWYSEALRDYSSSRHHNFSVSGGSGNVNYFGSFGSQSDDGIYTDNMTNYNRFNLKGNIDVKVNDYLNVGLDLTGIQENRMYPTVSEGAIFDLVTRMWPTSPALWPNGLPGPDFERGLQPMVMPTDQSGFDDDKRYRSNNMLSASLKIPWVDGLSLSGYYAYDIYYRKRKQFQTPWSVYNLDKPAYLAAGNTGMEDGSAFLIESRLGRSEPNLRDSFWDSESKTANLRLGYRTTFLESHNVDAFVAYEQNEYFNQGFDAYRRFFLSDQLPYLFAGGDEQKDNSGWVGLDASQNYFGRVSYDYNGMYMFQFSLRRDGSLRFSKEAGRWGNFPSVLIGWRPSEGNWWQTSGPGFIDHLKLRASWGQMGNDLVSSFQYLAMYGFSTGLPLGTNQTYEAGLSQVGVPNPLITWEVANVFNVGWEALLLNNKLSFETDLFHERRNNILVQRDVSVPQFIGIALPDENFGIVENRGLEVVLGYRDRAGSFSYGVNGNFAFARNKIIESDEPERPVPWQVRTGLPQGAHLLYNAIGIFEDWDHVNSMPHVLGAKPGDIIIEDYDGDGAITGADRQLFPLTTTPEITFGLSFDFKYRNWELRGLVQGHGRALRRINNNIQQGLAGNYFMHDAIDRWTPENTVATKPKAFNWSEEYWRSSHITTYFYHDMSFARLKNLQLSYRIPQSIMSNVGMKEARVYVAGQNLWLLWAAQNIVDPELRNGMSTYPIMRTISLGAQVSF